MSASVTINGIILAVSVGLLLASSTMAGEPASPSQTNLLANPGFEKPAASGPLPADWSAEARTYSRDETVSRSGKASLRYANTDKQRYDLSAQAVALQPGRKYELIAWIKTANVAGDGSGATICVEWNDKNGKWMGGTYPDGIKGDTDWTLIRHVVRIPPDAGACHFTCYVRKGMTGAAWFDDADIHRVLDPPMSTFLLSPAYRGWLWPDGTGEVRVRATLNLADHDLRPQDLKLSAELLPPGGGQAVASSQASCDGNSVDLSIPAGALKAGNYQVLVTLTGRDGNAISLCRHEVQRLPAGFQPTAAIDAHRRLVVEGKPFFPLGMYWSSINEQDLKLYADSNFNCLMPYGPPDGRQMDLAHRYGLKVIYSVKDAYFGGKYAPKSLKSVADEEPYVRARLREFRDHPALLAWYLNDELPQSFMPQLEAHQRWAEEEDPNHPTWVVLFQVDQLRDYARTFDAIGTDPYPIGRKPASLAGQWARKTVDSFAGARAAWMVPQVFNWGNYEKVPDRKESLGTPTPEEMRSMAWQCICEGATGLVFYSFFDIKRGTDVPFAAQWDRCKAVAAEISAVTPILLSVEPVGQVRADAPPWLHWLARKREGKLYLFAVNDGDGEGNVRFHLTAGPKSIAVLGENRSIAASDSGFTDAFKKLQVRIYRLDMP